MRYREEDNAALIPADKTRALSGLTDIESIGRFPSHRPSARTYAVGKKACLSMMSLKLRSDCIARSSIRDNGQTNMHEIRKNFLQKCALTRVSPPAPEDTPDPTCRKICCRTEITRGCLVSRNRPLRNPKSPCKSRRSRSAIVFPALLPPDIKRASCPAPTHWPGVYWPLASHSLSFCGFTACCAGFLRGFF